jgi:hypothetical protein
MSKKLNVDHSGGTYNIVSSLSDDCKDGSITFETDSDDWLTINDNSFTVHPTEDDRSRSATIHTFINFTDQSGNVEKKECGKYNIDINQKGAPCECNSFNITNFITSIPRSGLDPEYTIFKCSPKYTCPIDGMSGTLSINGETYRLNPVKTGTKEWSFQLTEGIDENEGRDSIPVEIKAHYTNEETGYNADCETKNISQQGVSCSCSNLDNVSLNLEKVDGNYIISENGLAAGVIGSYTFHDICDYFVARFVDVRDSSTYYNVTCSEGTLTLQTAIPSYDEKREKAFMFYVWYDHIGDASESCYSKRVKQNTSYSACTCSSVEVYNQVNEIPQPGYTNSGTTLVWFRMGSANESTPCINVSAVEVNGKFSLTTVIDTDSTGKPVKNAEGWYTGKLVTSTGVPANNNYNDPTVDPPVSNPYTYTIQMYYLDDDGELEPCKKVEIKQLAIDPCYCGSINNVIFALDTLIPSTKISSGTTLLTYKKVDENCDGAYGELTCSLCEDATKKYIILNGLDPDSIDTWRLYLGEDIPANTKYRENVEWTFKLMYHTGDFKGDVECETYTFTQEGVEPCTCDSMIEYTPVESLPNSGSGIAANTTILTYKTNPQSAHCKSNVSGTLIDICNDISYTLYNDDSGSGNIGYLKLESAIADNENFTPLQFELKVYHDSDYAGHEHEECKIFNIEQNGRVGCTCDDMGYYIDPYYRLILVPMGGFDDFEVVASGDTAIYATEEGCGYHVGDIVKVCGALSAKSTIDMLEPNAEGQKVIVQSDRLPGAKHDHLFYFLVKVIPSSTGRDDDGYIDLWFSKYKPDGSVEPSQCPSEVIHIKQTNNICNCNDFGTPRDVNMTNCLSASSVNILNLNYQYRWIRTDMWYFIEPLPAEEGGEIKIKNISETWQEETAYGQHYLYAYADIESNNDTGEDIIAGYISVSGVCNAGFTGEPHNTSTWDGTGKLCNNWIVPIRQPKCPECTCAYLSANGYLDHFSWSGDHSYEFPVDSNVGERHEVTILTAPFNLKSGCIVFAFMESCDTTITGKYEPLIVESVTDYTLFLGTDMNHPYEFKINGETWLYVYFQYDTTTGVLRMILELAKSTVGETQPWEDKFSYAVGVRENNEKGQYKDEYGIRYNVDWCDCAEFTANTEIRDCKDCDQEFNPSTSTSFSNCSTYTSAATYYGYCGKLKMTPCLQDGTVLTEEEAAETYPWVTGWTKTATSSMYVYARDDNSAEDAEDRVVYFKVCLMDDLEAGTYKGSECCKVIKVTQRKCTHPPVEPCDGTECQQYYYENGFNFNINTTSQYWNPNVQPEGQFEIPNNMLGTTALFFLGTVPAPVKEEWSQCIQIVADTSDVEGYIVPSTGMTEYSGNQVEVYAEFPRTVAEDLTFNVGVRLMYIYGGGYTPCTDNQGNQLYRNVRIVLKK